VAIISLDVGFKTTGFAVWDKGNIVFCGTIITEKSQKKTTRVADDYYERSSRLAYELNRLIDYYDIKGIVGELPSGGALSAKAAVMMNMATAVVASVATLRQLPCEWCTPNETKLAVCGYRSATKDEIMETVKKKFPESLHLFPSAKTYFEHIADAIGAYLALINGNIVRVYG
jgi:Holliday junction resolvasome RuvABC endonuclease subunit